LKEVIGDALELGVSSKKVCTLYEQLTSQIADEFTLLLDTPIERIEREGGNPVVAEAIRRVRAGQIQATPGYDGVFGTIKVFEKNDRPTQSALV
jgi:PHP family Zn ribbon phosphoesterase